MADITPQVVKSLRDKTGAGMADCKKALVESNGDMQAAIEFLRKKGAASAAKRADRTANEGVVVAKISDDAKIAVLVEVNCETDFVGKNAGFVGFAAQVADALFVNDPKNMDELMQVKIGNETVKDLFNDVLAKFSEKIELKRFKRLTTTGFFSAYNHANSKLGVIVEAACGNPNDAVKNAMHDVAMQVAAMNPQFVNRDAVDEARLNKEIEIYKELAINEGKKPEIAERVAQGRLEKFFQEQCLIEQAFVKDNTKTVNDYVKEQAGGEDIKIVSFVRYLLGEVED